MRIAERMTERKLKTLTKDCACGVVPGLVVSIRTLSDGTIAKYFLLRVRKIGRVFALGKYPSMTLSEAFAKAADWKEKIAQGIDPAEEEKAKAKVLSKTPVIEIDENTLTLEKLMYQWIDFNEARGRWKNKLKPRDEIWAGYFRNHIPKALRQTPVESITAEILADTFSEKWRTMIDTPERILADMKSAIDWAIRQEMIPPMINPAQVNGGKLGDLLPLQRAEGGHEPALPPARMPAFFKMLLEYTLSSPAARCLAFAILTAARNSTAREATWSEIQQDEAGNWIHVIPRSRMKVKAERLPFDRKTPLSSAAMKLLNEMPRLQYEGQDFLFPSMQQRLLSPITNTAFKGLIKRMHDRQRAIDGIGWIDPEEKGKNGEPRIVTLHGCARASFNTWAKDGKRFGHDYFPKELRESCLDHRNEAYKCAYDREQALGEMREVFEAWGVYLLSEVDDPKK